MVFMKEFFEKDDFETNHQTTKKLEKLTSRPRQRVKLYAGRFSGHFLPSIDFFSKSTFSKTSSGISSKCQTVWIQIRPDIFSGLIWVQTICKGYQQTTPVGKELKKCDDSAVTS